MDRQRWETVKEIFHAALEVPESERDAFIRTASEGDPEVYSSVNSLLQADQEAGDFLEVALATTIPPERSQPAPPPFQTDDILCQRFRIIRPVGEGGMGYVFEAWDKELGVRVALKAIRPEIASHPESLERFRREVRLALKITHPNVCRTFDIERETRVIDPLRRTTQEVVFLTMEFLEGETLAVRLARAGPLPLEDALHIARQASDALASAHEFGIVHRDIKPANIMLVSPAASSSAIPLAPPAQPRAVITDFGLARQDPVFKTSDHSIASSSGFLLGTFAYMAPEQLEGGQVSPATDIYAFGLVLFEMATGQRAFSSSNPLTGLTQRLTGPPPSPKSLVPTLPDSWCHAIDGCLRPDPADRFQKTADVLAALVGGVIPLPPVRVLQSFSHSTAPRPFFFLSWPLRHRLLAYSALFLFLMALFGGGQRLYLWWTTPPIVEPGALIYFVPVRNETKEKAFDNLTELVQAGMAQSAQINLLDQNRVGDILQLMTKAPDTVITPPIAREIAMRAGAVRVLFTSVTGSAGSYQLNVEIQQPDSITSRYREHWTNSFKWKSSDSTTSGGIPPELLSAMRSASNWIRHEVGESKNDIARLDAPPEDVTTGNWDALSQFAKAEKYGLQHERESAVFALQNAVAADPHFALAYMRLGDILVSLRRFEEGYDAYSIALTSENEQRLTRRERDRIKGIFALDTGDFQAAFDAFRDYAVYYPGDYLGSFYQAYPLMMLGRVDEALTALRRAQVEDPFAYSVPAHIARFDLILGRFDEAQIAINRLRQINHADDADDIEAGSEFLQGHYERAAQLYTKLKQSKERFYRTRSYTLLACLYAELGRYRDAISSLNNGINADLAEGDTADRADKLLARAYLELNQHDYTALLRDAKDAEQLDISPQRSVTAAGLVGRAVAETNGTIRRELLAELYGIRRALPRSRFSPLSDIVSARIHGDVLLAEGNADEALREFEKADHLDAPASDRDYLARGLLAGAKAQKDPARAARDRELAFQIYTRIVLHPGQIWQLPEEFPPGYLSDEILRLEQIASQTGMSVEQVKPQLREYVRRRQQVDQMIGALLHDDVSAK